MSSPNTITLCCATDANYIMPMTVMLTSALRNLSPDYQIDLRVIETGVSKSIANKCERILKQTGVPVTFTWYNAKDSFSQNLTVSSHLTQAALYRLLIPSLFEPEIEKIIYLDCDIIVENDLSQLWNTNLEGKPIAAVRSYGAPYAKDPFGIPIWKELSIDPQTPCFNSGILLINLPEWKNLDISNNVIEFLHQQLELLNKKNLTEEEALSKNAFTHLYDQYGLNAVLRGNWKELNPKWNQSHAIYNYKEWPDSKFKQDLADELESLIKNPYIIHYTSSVKPWHLNSNHPLTARFHFYLEQSKWMNVFQKCIWKNRSQLPSKLLRRFPKIYWK